MSRIRVPIQAYILGLFPQAEDGGRRRTGSPRQGRRLRALANGLAVPSFWSRTEVNQAFAEANRIWIREADIEFSPVTVSARVVSVPADERGMWIGFVNQLGPRGGGIGVGFVHDLPSQEGGWGGGRIAVVSGVKARSGLAGFAGSLLAHELGHVLIDDPNHEMARGDAGNLMFGRRNPRVANAGLLRPEQVAEAQRRARTLGTVARTSNRGTPGGGRSAAAPASR